MISKNHLYKCTLSQPKSKMTNYNQEYKMLTSGRRSREPKRSVGQEGSRAGQPALLGKPSPLWKAPLRSRPRNLNMQIQRVKT